MTLTARHWRFSVDDYVRMHDLGIIAEDVRTELIDGEIIEMPPIGPPHASTVGRLNHVFGQWLGDRALVWVQNPLLVGAWSMPQPDIVLLRPREDFYVFAHPEPIDALLVIEVSETSIRYDRQTKLPLYARAGIAEVWLAVLPKGRLEVYREPAEGYYKSKTILTRGERVSPLAFPELDIAVEELVGPAALVAG